MFFISTIKSIRITKKRKFYLSHYFIKRVSSIKIQNPEPSQKYVASAPQPQSIKSSPDKYKNKRKRRDKPF